jgi:hypothetical protein
MASLRWLFGAAGLNKQSCLAGNWTGWFVVIVDQHGQKVDEVPIADI